MEENPNQHNLAHREELKTPDFSQHLSQRQLIDTLEALTREIMNSPTFDKNPNDLEMNELSHNKYSQGDLNSNGQETNQQGNLANDQIEESSHSSFQLNHPNNQQNQESSQLSSHLSHLNIQQNQESSQSLPQLSHSNNQQILNVQNDQNDQNQDISQTSSHLSHLNNSQNQQSSKSSIQLDHLNNSQNQQNISQSPSQPNYPSNQQYQESSRSSSHLNHSNNSQNQQILSQQNDQNQQNISQSSSQLHHPNNQQIPTRKAEQWEEDLNRISDGLKELFVRLQKIRYNLRASREEKKKMGDEFSATCLNNKSQSPPIDPLPSLLNLEAADANLDAIQSALKIANLSDFDATSQATNATQNANDCTTKETPISALESLISVTTQNASQNATSTQNASQNATQNATQNASQNASQNTTSTARKKRSFHTLDANPDTFQTGPVKKRRRRQKKKVDVVENQLPAAASNDIMDYLALFIQQQQQLNQQEGNLMGVSGWGTTGNPDQQQYPSLITTPSTNHQLNHLQFYNSCYQRPTEMEDSSTNLLQLQALIESLSQQNLSQSLLQQNLSQSLSQETQNLSQETQSLSQNQPQTLSQQTQSLSQLTQSLSQQNLHQCIDCKRWIKKRISNRCPPCYQRGRRLKKAKEIEEEAERQRKELEENTQAAMAQLNQAFWDQLQHKEM